MKKKLSKPLVTAMLLSALISQNAMAIKLPDIGKMASEAASGISEAAGQAGEAISDTAKQAGKTISDVAGDAGEMVSEAAGQAGKVLSDGAQGAASGISEFASQAGEIASGFASQAGGVISEWGSHAGETADTLKQDLSDAGVKLKVSAQQLGNATVEKASGLTDKAGKTADDAIRAASGAADYVVDQAGHVVDLAAVGAGYVSSAAGEAFRILQDKGEVLMKIAEDAVADIDLSEPENWDEARVAVDAAIEKAYEYEILDKSKTDEETVRVVTSIIFGTMMYGYQYSNGLITLGEYTRYMSEMLIREGLPTGVGFIVAMLPIKAPYAESLAKDATYYLISVAYGDKSGEEIEAEEEALLAETGQEEHESMTENTEEKVKEEATE